MAGWLKAGGARNWLVAFKLELGSPRASRRASREGPQEGSLLGRVGWIGWFFLYIHIKLSYGIFHPSELK